MRKVALIGALATSSGMLLTFCSSDTNPMGSDASPDGTLQDVATTDAGPLVGFTISVGSAHITADLGDATGNRIDVHRAPSFREDVGFTITNVPLGVVASTPIDVSGTSIFTSSALNLTIGSGAALGDYVITVTGQSKPSGAFTASATFGLHIGTLLEPGDAGYVVPSFATAVIVKAWGAGGGGGSGYTACAAAGAQGGGGGFAGGLFAATPMSTLVPYVGSGGEGGGACGTSSWWGGGGGGFTALKVQGAPDSMLVVGGGGGGGAGNSIAWGGAGGGLAGTIGYNSCAGSGGTQTAGGVAFDAGCANPGNNGSASQGGAGFSDGCTTGVVTGGPPGGGAGGVIGVSNCGGQGGGGGGGGYYGGAGAGQGSGGGGGSGWIPDAGVGQLQAGNHATPANTTDSDYVLCPANTGVGGDGGAPGSAGSPGGSGCLVVRLTKP